MRLIYLETGAEVKVGDKVKTFRDESAIVKSFSKPHKSNSEGKISVQMDGHTFESEFYVSVIGAKWIDREDRQ